MLERIGGKIIRFIRAHCGNVLIEFALVLPIFTLVISNSFELVMFALIQNKITRLSGIMADTISRKALDRATLQAILSKGPVLIEPFSSSPLKVVISQIRNEGETDDPVDMLISWQESFQGGSSEFGIPGSAPSPLPNDLEIINDQTLIVAEVEYTYQSLVFLSLITSRKLNGSISLFRVLVR